MSKEDILVLVCVVIIAIGCFYLGTQMNGLVFTKSENYNKITGNNNCSGLNLFMTEGCLQDELETFYKYNISNVGKKMELDLIKQEGGVCSHYADWYKDRAIQLGATYSEQEKVKYDRSSSDYHITQCLMSTGSDSSHIISILSSEEGYCVLDQLNNKCWRFENGV